MADVAIRRAARYDTRAMARLLNEIIATGGTTAKTDPVTPEEIARLSAAPGAAWHVAEAGGRLVGLQWVEPHEALPPGACDIATFVRQERAGLGIGSALFKATRAAAKRLGYAWINATIRTDNPVGLAYYQSRGFRDWQRLEGVPLGDGTLVDKICKRFDLD
jgi:GNAT superfamily N-acetyltransferase